MGQIPHTLVERGQGWYAKIGIFCYERIILIERAENKELSIELIDKQRAVSKFVLGNDDKFNELWDKLKELSTP